MDYSVLKNLASTHSLTQLYCEQCNCELGAKMLNCSSKQATYCPYELNQAPISSAKGFGFIMIIFGLAFAGAGLMFFPFGIIFTLGGLACSAIGAVISFGQRKILFNKHTGQMWQQASLFGFELVNIHASRYYVLEFNSEITTSIKYPVSLTPLYNYSTQHLSSEKNLEFAVSVFYTTLTYLASQGYLEIKYSFNSTTIIGKQKKSELVFILFPTKKAWISPPTGELERRILKAVQEWSQKTDPDINFGSLTHVRAFTCYLTLDDLIAIVFEGKKYSPANWLITEVIGKDAINYGFGELEGRWSKNLKIFTHNQALLASEYRIVSNISESPYVEQNNIYPTLYNQIEKSIKSREDSD